MAYSMDYRLAAARVYDECGSSTEVADLFGCSPAWVRRLIQRRRAAGGVVEPARSTARTDDQRTYDDADEREIRKLIAAEPDATLDEVVAHVGKAAHPTTACRTLARLGLPRKKSRRTRPSGTGRT